MGHVTFCNVSDTTIRRPGAHDPEATIINATRFIRKMRGGSQAHLLQGDDGYFYVVKFRNNPQTRRVLVNEWIASFCLQHLGISSPAVSIVSLSNDFLNANPDVHIELGSKRLAVHSGLHFGSRHVGRGGSLAVYDFVSDTLLERIVNLPEFAGIMAFDKWTGNADARQAIFLRTGRLPEGPLSTSELSSQRGFVAYMIDHGQIFGGSYWRFADSPLQGLYFRPVVYRNVKSLDDFQPWLDRVMNFPEEVIRKAMKSLPELWLAEDAGAMDTLLAKLMSRRKRVPDLIREARQWRTDPFPQWR